MAKYNLTLTIYLSNLLKFTLLNYTHEHPKTLYFHRPSNASYGNLFPIKQHSLSTIRREIQKIQTIVQNSTLKNQLKNTNINNSIK